MKQGAWQLALPPWNGLTRRKVDAAMHMGGNKIHERWSYETEMKQKGGKADTIQRMQGWTWGT